MNFDLPSALAAEPPSEQMQEQADEPTVYMDLKPLESPVSENTRRSRCPPLEIPSLARMVRPNLNCPCTLQSNSSQLKRIP